MNKSINQTLSRTILTSGLTFLTVLVLYLMGGEVLRAFSFAMVVGVVVGTYSSFGIAAPIVVLWNKYHGGQGARRPRRIRSRQARGGSRKEVGICLTSWSFLVISQEDAQALDRGSLGYRPGRDPGRDDSDSADLYGGAAEGACSTRSWLRRSTAASASSAAAPVKVVQPEDYSRYKDGRAHGDSEEQSQMIKDEAPDRRRGSTAASASPAARAAASGRHSSVARRPPPPPKPAAPLASESAATSQAAKLLRQVTPVYPPIAKTAHVSGTVILHAIIAKDGTIQELQYVSGPPLLMKAAMDAVREWRYKPHHAQWRSRGSGYHDFCCLYAGRLRQGSEPLRGPGCWGHRNSDRQNIAAVIDWQERRRIKLYVCEFTVGA